MMQGRTVHSLKAILDVILNAGVMPVIMIGDSYVGKTSILKSYSGNTEQKNRQTDYIDITIKRNDQPIRLTVYDTGGQERFRSLTTSYYRGALGCVLCFDVTKSETFKGLERWLQDVHDYIGHETACVLVATRCGGRREVSEGEALAFAHKREIPLIELHSLDRQNIDKIFKLLVDLMINKNHDLEGECEITDNIKSRTSPQDSKNGCSC